MAFKNGRGTKLKANLTDVQGKIGELEKQLDIIGTRQTEVYARIVGYYRSVKNWNKGKKEEYCQRVSFSDNQCKNSQSITKNKQPTLI